MTKNNILRISGNNDNELKPYESDKNNEIEDP